MQTYQLSYFIGQEFFGEAEVESDFDPHSLRYCCQTCGRVWASVIVSPGETTNFLETPCEEHRGMNAISLSQVPGSLLFNLESTKNDLAKMWWARAIDHMPQAVLEREFELAVKHYEKESEGLE